MLAIPALIDGAVAAFGTFFQAVILPFFSGISSAVAPALGERLGTLSSGISDGASSLAPHGGGGGYMHSGVTRTVTIRHK